MNKFSIVKHAKIFFSITAVVLIVGIVSMFTRGFNLGIDFTGGSILDIKFDQPVSVAQVRTVLSDHQLGSSVIQLGSSDQQVETSQSVLIRTGIISDSQRVEVMNDLTSRLGKNEVLRVENVGATVGGDLVKSAIGAVVLSWVLMIIYITIFFFRGCTAYGSRVFRQRHHRGVRPDPGEPPHPSPERKPGGSGGYQHLADHDTERIHHPDHPVCGGGYLSVRGRDHPQLFLCHAGGLWQRVLHLHLPGREHVAVF